MKVLPALRNLMMTHSHYMDDKAHSLYYWVFKDISLLSLHIPFLQAKKWKKIFLYLG